MAFTIKDYDLRDCFKFERRCLLLAGIWPQRDGSHRIPYICNRVINIIISCGQLFSMIIQIAFDRHKLSDIIQTLLYFVTQFTFICKSANLHYCGSIILNIEDLLSNPVFYGFTFVQLKVVKGKIRVCDGLARIFRILCVVTISFYALVPYFDENKKNSLPLPGWLPCGGEYYILKFVLQISSACISAFCNSSIDVLTCKLISIASAQFEILNDNLKNMDCIANPENEGDDFKRCIQHHIKTLDLITKVQTALSKGLFLQFFTSVMVICTTLFQMMVEPIASVQYLVLVVYLVVMLIQVAFYCWYGHDIIATSNEIGTSLYMSNWYLSDKKLRKLAVIFLGRTMNPMIMKAGNFIPLSLPTLLKILRSSYSYFTVLQQLYKNNL